MSAWLACAYSVRMYVHTPLVSVALIVLTLLALGNQGSLPVALRGGNRLVQLLSSVWLVFLAYVAITWFLRTQV